MVHGTKGLHLAQKTTDILYGEDDNDTSLKLANLTQSEMSTIFAQANYMRLLYTPGLSLIDFAVKIGCFSREKDAQRIITAGGFYVNEVRKTNIDELLIQGIHILPNNLSLARVGKRNYYIIEWTV